MTREHSHKAFTLIELLVVVAIIAVLVAMLIPTLASAREIVRFTICKANMKQASTGWNGFVNTHDGRYPGGASGRFDYWYVCWMQLLNREWYHGNDPTYYPPSGAYWDEPTVGPIIKFWAFGDPTYYKPQDLKNKYITCPDYKAWAGSGGSNMWWSRPWLANDHTVAGHYYDPSDTSWCDPSSPTNGFFQDGIQVADNKVPNDQYRSKWTSPSGSRCFYALGRKQESWASPSSKYLMWEAESYNDMDRYNPGEGAASANGTLKLGDDGTFAPWCAEGGHQAFRHLLPPDTSLWQSRARAPILYIDGHVGEWSPNAPQYLEKNFSPSM